MNRPKPTDDPADRSRERLARQPLRMPDPIDATPEEIARVVLNDPAERDRRLLNDQRRND